MAVGVIILISGGIFLMNRAQGSIAVDEIPDCMFYGSIGPFINKRVIRAGE